MNRFPVHDKCHFEFPDHSRGGWSFAFVAARCDHATRPVLHVCERKSRYGLPEDRGGVKPRTAKVFTSAVSQSGRWHVSLFTRGTIGPVFEEFCRVHAIHTQSTTKVGGRIWVWSETILQRPVSQTQLHPFPTTTEIEFGVERWGSATTETETGVGGHPRSEIRSCSTHERRLDANQRQVLDVEDSFVRLCPGWAVDVRRRNSEGVELAAVVCNECPMGSNRICSNPLVSVLASWLTNAPWFHQICARMLFSESHLPTGWCRHVSEFLEAWNVSKDFHHGGFAWQSRLTTARGATRFFSEFPPNSEWPDPLFSGFVSSTRAQDFLSQGQGTSSRVHEVWIQTMNPFDHQRIREDQTKQKLRTTLRKGVVM